jgi:hypothetical protein
LLAVAVAGGGPPASSPPPEVRIEAADLLHVATHEIGHVLDLPHSPLPASVMFARVRHDVAPLLALPAVDVAAAQAVHGVPEGWLPPQREEGGDRGGFNSNFFLSALEHIFL